MTAFEVIHDFPAAMADRAGAWNFIRGFAATWRSPLADGDGWSEADLDAAEARLGVRLPAALREAYQLFGRRTDLTSLQDVLLSPADLEVKDQALVFRAENQAVVFWGIPIAELDQPDPPVVLRTDLADKGAESWDSWLDRFSHACLELVLSESLFSSEDLGDNRALAEGEASMLAQRFTRLPLPDYPTSQTAVPAVRWFADPDLIIRDDQRTWIWVRARTAEALAQIRTELPGDWMMDYSY
ncbi:SMI1/KNR4 family protein [Nonomuraea sp. 3N208]|uniref:SMI1/KNR4 family protein n=1 Tax=Nonomuraea sp. 3N208 TaxID=3457421 RepID=UPI003FD296AA